MSDLRLYAALWFGVVGAVLGSFLTVVVARLPLGESLVRPPSHCPGCGTRLGAAELVPIFSYLAQRGQCRHCGRPIPRGYLLIEITASLGSAALAYHLLPSTRLYPALLLLLLGITVTAVDLAHHIIPDRLLVAATLLFCGLRLAHGPGSLLTGLAGAGLMLPVALIIAVAARGGFGFGDLKYLAVVGFALGPAEGLLAFFLAAVSGGLYAIGLLALRRATRRDAVAFGPFIACGSMAALLAGPAVLSFYTHLL